MNIGKTLILVGIGIVVLGIIIYFFGDKFSWFGKLPGDIRIEKDNGRFYFPLTSMFIVSVILNVVIWLLKKYF